MRIWDGSEEKPVKACKDYGFFYLENHGIPEEMIQEVFDQSKAFFDLDIEAKMAVESNKNNRGYRPMGSEKINRANQTKGYTKELFDLFRDLDPDSEEAGKPLRGPNQWPPESLVPGWRATMTSYFNTLHTLAERVVGLLAVGIGIDPSFFEGRFSASLAALRLLHYSSEVSDPEKGVFGIGEHSDFSMLSFLAITGELPGLQILLNGEWIDVPPRRGAFICNVGDMLERWTNNHLRSTVHRVVNKLGRERYSIPFFLAPNFDTEVACLPQFCSEDDPPKYPPTTSGRHLSEKLLGLTSEEGGAVGDEIVAVDSFKPPEGSCSHSEAPR